MRQSNGCSTPAPRYSAAKQWLEQLAQKKKWQWQLKVRGKVFSIVVCFVFNQRLKQAGTAYTLSETVYKNFELAEIIERSEHFAFQLMQVKVQNVLKKILKIVDV